MERFHKQRDIVSFWLLKIAEMQLWIEHSENRLYGLEEKKKFLN